MRALDCVIAVNLPSDWIAHSVVHTIVLTVEILLIVTYRTERKVSLIVLEAVWKYRWSINTLVNNREPEVPHSLA